MSIVSNDGNVSDIIKIAVAAEVECVDWSYPYNCMGGILTPAQSDKFIDMITDTDEFLQEVSCEKTEQAEGYIASLSITPRNFRRKVEWEDNITGNEMHPIVKEVPYKTVSVAMGTELSNNWFRKYVGRENIEELFMRLTANQIGLDTLDLALNGDESSDDPFLNINDGWLKILSEKIPAAQIINGASYCGGFFTDQYIYDLVKCLPRHYYNQSRYKLICSHATSVKLMEFLRSRQSAANDAALINDVQFNPLAISFANPASFPDNIILLGDPTNLITVWTNSVKLHKTIGGKELAAKDNRLYTWFFDMDFIVSMPESFTMLSYVGEVAAPVPVVVNM